MFGRLQNDVMREGVCVLWSTCTADPRKGYKVEV